MSAEEPAEAVPRDGVALEVRGLWKTYGEESAAPVHALRGVDLVVRVHEFVAIVGPSGSGKSTLINLIADLGRPSEGSVRVAGEQLENKGIDDLARMRRRHIGLVFQSFHLLEGMTVLENVSLPAIIAGVARETARARGTELLDLLGLGRRKANLPGALSGGERQRLALARAMANRPTILLADEPTGALDSAGGREILGLLQRFHGRGQTILVVTHDDQVAKGAQRIVSMRDGQMHRGGAQSADARPTGSRGTK